MVNLTQTLTLTDLNPNPSFTKEVFTLSMVTLRRCLLSPRWSLNWGIDIRATLGYLPLGLPRGIDVRVWGKAGLRVALLLMHV